jgi:hypothetical protein
VSLGSCEREFDLLRELGEISAIDRNSNSWVLPLVARQFDEESDLVHRWFGSTGVNRDA